MSIPAVKNIKIVEPSSNIMSNQKQTTMLSIYLSIYIIILITLFVILRSNRYLSLKQDSHQRLKNIKSHRPINT